MSSDAAGAACRSSAAAAPHGHGRSIGEGAGKIVDAVALHLGHGLAVSALDGENGVIAGETVSERKSPGAGEVRVRAGNVGHVAALGVLEPVAAAHAEALGDDAGAGADLDLAAALGGAVRHHPLAAQVLLGAHDLACHRGADDAAADHAAQHVAPDISSQVLADGVPGEICALVGPGRRAGGERHGAGAGTGLRCREGGDCWRSGLFRCSRGCLRYGFWGFGAGGLGRGLTGADKGEDAQKAQCARFHGRSPVALKDERTL